MLLRASSLMLQVDTLQVGLAVVTFWMSWWQITWLVLSTRHFCYWVSIDLGCCSSVQSRFVVVISRHQQNIQGSSSSSHGEWTGVHGNRVQR